MPKMPNSPNKTTQTLHRRFLATPAGPVEIIDNPTAEWFSITAPDTIPYEYLPAVIFSLQTLDLERKKRPTTTRKRDNDDQTH